MVVTTPVVSDANNLKLEKNMKEKIIKDFSIIDILDKVLQCYNITYIMLFQCQLYYCRVRYEYEIKILFRIKSFDTQS